MSQEELQDSCGVKGFTPTQLEGKICKCTKNHEESRLLSQKLVKSLKISGTTHVKELMGEVPECPFEFIDTAGHLISFFT